ncbi:MFS transporter [Flavobacterium beibuense]|uniref:MFS transporter n=1 Tax=Flavobacterium beibuense TaxID=657326 RepID=UPI0021D352B0|nr:MFS transporter [Flavobacterium beibuense]
MDVKKGIAKFSSHQKLVIAMLGLTQFTVILDFMVISPLGDILMKNLDMTTANFGFAVSAYAFSAGISGLLAAGFADKFDRKKLLIFFYTGFILGTFCCAMANSYLTLVAARIVTGLFGGVIGSVSLAIVTDLFILEQRGRVMGFIQMAFATSQILGIPLGLYFANNWGWHSSFLMIVVLAIAIQHLSL